MRTRGGGLDLMGQRMIFGLGQAFVLLLIMIPGAGAALLIGVITYGLLPVGAAGAIISGTGILIPVFIGEIWCVLWWLGERFEKLDLSAELRA